MVERVPCEECGNIVASTSRLCPHCGSKGPNSLRNLPATVTAVGIGIALLFSGANWVFSKAKDALGGDTPTVSGTAASLPPATTPESDPAAHIENAEPAIDDRLTGAVPEAAPTPEPSTAEAQPPPIDEAAATAAEANAIGKALDSGADAEWNAGGVSGRIEIQPADSSGDQPCLRYRAIRGDDRSGFRKVCKGDDGGWH